MTFMEAVVSFYKNYFNFSGRTPRSGYWWFFLFNIVVSVAIMLIEGGGSMGGGGGGFSAAYTAGPIGTIWSLANLIPGIAVGVRRLHDIDKSGWWLLIALIPLIGAIVLIVWFCTRGTGDNRFGADPLGGNMA